jgi:ribosomal protein L40E
VAAEAGRPTTTCPDCGGPVRPDRERLCRRCGYPLMFLRDAPDRTAFGPARIPGERDDATGVLPPARRDEPRLTTVDELPPLAPGELVCPRCGERNPPERVRCQRCGQELRTGQPRRPPPPRPAPLPPPLPAAAPAPRRSLRQLWPLAVALAGAALLIGAAVVLATLGPDLSRSPGQTAAGQPDLVRVPAAEIGPSASSTILDPPFPVENTVDGDGGTAWQSDGRRLASNVGVTLTFEFASPVRLARITIVNGYARTPGDFANNERIARLRVSGGDWSARWELRDTADPQTLDVDAGEIGAVTFEVEAVYPSARFKQLAVSEVAFDARP